MIQDGSIDFSPAQRYVGFAPWTKDVSPTRFGKLGPGEGNLSRDSKGCLPRTNPATYTAGTLDPEILAANRPRSGTFFPFSPQASHGPHNRALDSSS